MYRIQQQHSYNWQAPGGAVYVGKPTQWANPYESYIFGAERAVMLFRRKVERMSEAERAAWLAPLRLRAHLLVRLGPAMPC
jgi:hypothetical protein